MYRFGDVLGEDLLALGQIGNRPRGARDAVEGAG